MSIASASNRILLLPGMTPDARIFDRFVPRLPGASLMNHVVLLGDSIFDNGRYVVPGPSVIDQLRTRLPKDWCATLIAKDGAVTEEIEKQLARFPADATHLIVSVGGNDALEQSAALLDESGTPMGLLSRMADIRAEFQQVYRRMLQSVRACGKPTAVCTVYDSVPGLERRELTGLCLFNDAILREAFRLSIPVIDLRFVCTDRDDYAKSSPIEPSVAGGAKIARVIARTLATHDFESVGSRIFT
jgi:hypothetical protein